MTRPTPTRGAQPLGHSAPAPTDHSVILQRFDERAQGQVVACERYARIAGSDGLTFIVQWDGDLEPDAIHRFLRETGHCIESHAGIMRGYRIADFELSRLAAQRAPGR